MDAGKDNLIKIQMAGAKELGRFNFDGATLPPVILPQIPHRMRPTANQEGARVVMETRIIQNLIQSYFDLTKKNIADQVPKIIMHFLVNESIKEAQKQLIEKVY